MLTIRPRGKNGIFYIRGQVSLGDKRIDVKEFGQERVTQMLRRT